jgi:hypothetical protein
LTPHSGFFILDLGNENDGHQRAARHAFVPLCRRCGCPPHGGPELARLCEAPFLWAGGINLEAEPKIFQTLPTERSAGFLISMKADDSTNPNANEPLLTTLRSFPRPVWILFAGVFLNKFGTFVVPFLTIYLTRQGFSTADAGLAIGAYGLGRLGAAFIGGHLADTLGRRKTIVLSMVLAAVSMLLLSQARTLPAIVLLTGLASLTGELYLPACAALLADLVPEHRRVTAYAAYRLSFNAGWAFGPAAAAFLAAHSFLWLFVGDAITSVLFAVVAWFLLPRGVRSAQAEAGWGEAWTVLRQDRRMHQVALATLLIGLEEARTSASHSGAHGR